MGPAAFRFEFARGHACNMPLFVMSVAQTSALVRRSRAAIVFQVHVAPIAVKTVWPSGLRRWLQAPIRKGVGSNPTAVIFIFLASAANADYLS